VELFVSSKADFPASTGTDVVCTLKLKRSKPTPNAQQPTTTKNQNQNAATTGAFATLGNTLGTIVVIYRSILLHA